MGVKLASLRERLTEVADLTAAEALLSWDQHTYMPVDGAAARAEEISTVQRLIHRLFTSAEMRRLLDEAEVEAGALALDDPGRSLVEVTRRDLDDALKLPEDLVSERARTSALALEGWMEARRLKDYALFAPWLQRTLDLERRVADCRGYEAHPYDALLDAYEKGLKSADVARVFSELKGELQGLVRRIAGAGVVPTVLPEGDYPEEVQARVSRELAEHIGYDFRRGRIDPTAHPFASGFSKNDVRITTRYDRQDLLKAVFAALHETGHALYEQGIADDIDRTPLAGGASLGVHESQSRLWENVVGRSLGFWRKRLGILQNAFPDLLARLTVEEFYRAINRVEPSFIRVEADEVTYNLHVLLRFEVEMELVAGTLSVKEAPEMWNARMQDFLGIAPPDDSAGILQDVHWSMGAIGYFPTYTLGSLLACQLWETAVEANPAIPGEIEAGESASLLAWLRENIHRHGRRFLPAELVKRSTGAPLSAAPFLRYLKGKYELLYGLSAP